MTILQIFNILKRTSTNNILDVPELITIDEDDKGNPNIIVF